MTTWRPGVYRCVAKDGTVAAVLFAPAGDGVRMVEFVTVGRIGPPARRPRPRRIAASLTELRERSERRRLEQLVEALRDTRESTCPTP